MPGLQHTMAAIPAGTTRRTWGVAFFDGARWWANVGGNLLAARWNTGIRVSQGLPVVVDITNDGQGQSTALVVCGYRDQPLPGTGSVTAVIPAGVATEIEFDAEYGGSYRTDQFIGSFNPGDPVYLNWDAEKPTIMGAIGAVASTPAAEAPPPTAPVVGNGSTVLLATASDTYWGPGGWGSYATSINGGEDVYTGTWYGSTVTGAWFYGAPRPELQGKTVTRVQFKVPARLPAGSHNSPALIHFYAHTSSSRPGGDVSRVIGPHDITIPAGWSGAFVDLPASFGTVLAAGGGISIAGDPYAAFQGRLRKYNDRIDPESGKLLVDWQA